MIAAILDSYGVVSNVIKIDEDSTFSPDAGFTLIILDENDHVGIGYTWDDGSWIAPELPEPEEPPIPVEDKLAEMQAVLDMLVAQTLEGQ